MPWSCVTRLFFINLLQRTGQKDPGEGETKDEPILFWGSLVIIFIFPVEGHFFQEKVNEITNFYILSTHVLDIVLSDIENVARSELPRKTQLSSFDIFKVKVLPS